MATTVHYRFVVKRDTAAAFVAANTLLLEGEFGLELDTGRAKMGDGVTRWNDMAYYSIPGPFLVDGIADGDVMVWDATYGMFVPAAPSGGSASFPAVMARISLRC